MKPQVEMLENRDCPSGVNLTNGVLTVTGGYGKEVITVTQSPAQPNSPQTIQVNLNGVKTTYNASQVNQIVIDGSAGSKDVLTNLTSLPATITGSKYGNDDLQSFGSQSTINLGRGNDLVYDILGSQNVINIAPGNHHDVIADNVNSTVNGATKHDQVAVFFQKPIGSQSIFLDNSGSLFIYPSNNGSNTVINQVGNQIVVTYTDGAPGSVPQNYYYPVSAVHVIGFFGGAGSDSIINNSHVDSIFYGSGGTDFIESGWGRINLVKIANGSGTAVVRGTGFNDIGGGEIDGVPGASTKGYDVLFDLGTGNHDVVRYGPLDQYFITNQHNHDTIVPLF